FSLFFLIFASTFKVGKALKQILDQIFGIFTTGREADQIIGQTQLGARFGRNRSVCHRGGMAQQGLDATETLAERKEAARGGKRDNLVNRAIQLERNHSTKAGHLLAGNIVARMGSKAREVDAADERLVLEGIG